MYTQVYVCLLIFSKIFLQRDIEDMSILIVFLLFISLSYRSFSHNNKIASFIFPTGFFEVLYMTIEH
jgi:hypothetical protein